MKPLTGQTRTLERRLRQDLPALAEHLTGTDAATIGAPTATRRPLLIAAALVIIAGLALWLTQRETDSNTDIGPAVDGPELHTSTPIGPGEWRAMSDAPIEPRHFAATTWVDGEMIVWAGSSLNRLFAHTDGAAYDPVTDSWRELPVPGWGHPGLRSTWWNELLVTVAKGAITTIDFDTGSDTELPGPEGRSVVDVGVIAGDLYALTLGDDGRQDLALYRLGHDRTDWQFVAGGLAAIAAEPRIVTNGREALVRLGPGLSHIYDGDEGFDLIALGDGTGQVFHDTAVVVAQSGLAQVLSVDGEDSVAVLVDGEWQLTPIDLPEMDLANTTAVGAGEWIMLFPADSHPVSVHVATGTVLEHTGEVPGSLDAPNTVWTGEELIVWGGSTPEGAVWTPE